MTTDDDLKVLYDEATGLDDRRPGGKVRAAILAHAKTVQPVQGGADVSAVPRVRRVREVETNASNSSNWKLAIAASVVMVPLLGLLVSHLHSPMGSDTGTQVALNTPPAEISASPQSNLPLPSGDAVQAVPSRSKAVVSETPGLPAASRADATTASLPSSQGKSAESVLMAEASSKADSAGATGRSESVVVAAQEGSDAKVAATAARTMNMGLAGPSAQVAAAPASPSVMAPALETAQKAKLRNQLADASVGDAAILIEQLAQMARVGNVTELRVLVKRGAPVDGLDAMGQSALMNAVAAQQGASVETLLQLGADPRLKGKDGVSAIELATRLSDQSILMLLQR